MTTSDPSTPSEPSLPTTVDPDEDVSTPTRKAGRNERELISALWAAIRTARQHALDHPATLSLVHELGAKVAAAMLGKGRVAVSFIDGRITVNGRAVRPRAIGPAVAAEADRFFRGLGVGGLVLRGTLAVPALTSLVRSLVAPDPRPPDVRRQRIAAEAQRIPEPAFADVLSPEEALEYAADEGDGRLDDVERATFYYARLVALAEASRAAVGAGQSPDFQVRHLRMTLVKVVEYLRVGAFEVQLLSLTGRPRPAGDPAPAHAANVAVLTMAMGRLLGLGRGTLSDLGFAALHHDLGAATGPYDPAHVLSGVAHCLRGRGFGEAGLIRLVVAQEHHRVADGYPRGTGLRAPHLFSQLVALADAFDHLEHETRRPAQALRALADRGRFPSPVWQVLRDVLGQVPRGTLLRLRDGAVVAVVEGGARRGHRPIVRQLLRPDGAVDGRTLLELRDPSAVQAELDPGDLPPQAAQLR